MAHKGHLGQPDKARQPEAPNRWPTAAETAPGGPRKPRIHGAGEGNGDGRRRFQLTVNVLSRQGLQRLRAPVATVIAVVVVTVIIIPVVIVPVVIPVGRRDRLGALAVMGIDVRHAFALVPE
jgi:hypothetical protein